MLKKITISGCLVLFISLFAFARQSHATLGEPVDSVDSDRKALSAVRLAAKSHARYTVEEIESDANTLREYISPAGIVFAIAWNGISYPDLTRLTGRYSDEYIEALQQTKRQRGKRRLRVETDNIVVEKWGHMRNLQGRAYVPSLVPPGVSINEIK